MAALTAKTALTEDYQLVADAVVRAVARASKTATICIVPDGATAPANSAPGIVLACPEPFDFGPLGSACDVYAKGDGNIVLFTNTV
jgi:hypothetical protein